MKPYSFSLAILLVAVAMSAGAANNQILGWNNLGMHCMDSDYSVFSVLPPYNTIEAQLVVNGHLLTASNGYSVTYQAVADPSGSFNATAMGKGNYYDYATALYGAVLAPEGGLAGWSMPGTNNAPQNMWFEVTNHPAPGATPTVNWWRAEGIPISPYDDAHNKNPYPLMLLVARDAGNRIIATNQVVLPVSDEMDCRACHASGSPTNAQPAAGWVWSSLPERDFRLNILRLHDEHQFAQHTGLYQAALAARGFNPAGLYRSVTADGKPVLCAVCHASEALGLGSYSNIPPLTASVHSFHGHVTAPGTTNRLDDVAFRSACYLCHPGSATRCLRGAMGSAIASDGTMEMQCQSCHGNMSNVGTNNRVGWFMEPKCQSCHSGTAMSNNGQIRYTSCFTNSTYGERQAVDQTFATVSNTPASGISLFRFSAGHGGLQCEACHGSTHAEFPSTHLNDNLRNIQIQGHAGMMVECTACHTSSPTNNFAGGPHGMHPVGTNWVSLHPAYAETNSPQCRNCHGSDYRGTVLSRMQADRTLNAFGTKTFFRGAIIGCYTCHNGPGSETANASTPPAVNNVSATTTNDQSVAMTLPATGTGLTLRIISQPANGSVGLNGSTATYFPNPGFVGTDTFTFAAYDGSKNSNLATGTVAVAQGPLSLGVSAHVPPAWPAAWPVAFAAFPAVTNSAAPVTYDWNFGDGSAPNTNQYAAHAYAASGNYPWKLIATVSGVSVTNTGNIAVGTPVRLAMSRSGNTLSFTWPVTSADTLLEQSDVLGAAAHWTATTNAVMAGTNIFTLNLPAAGNGFFRVRQTQ
ncbi:MAG TPA: Ig-like domain-containing protein [Candidatus Acidoferrum sp.]|nr:Ig-like domain-containing protein [Candidatus Acidoferrum sp.]